MEKSRHDLKIGRKKEKKKKKDESRSRFGTGEEKRKTRKMKNCHWRCPENISTTPLPIRQYTPTPQNITYFRQDPALSQGADVWVNN